MSTDTQPASLSALVEAAITDTQALVKGQIELTKTELKEQMNQTAKASSLLIGAGVLGFLGFVFVLVAIAWGLVAAGLPTWAGFLIVAVVLLIIAAILGIVGRNRVKKVTPPERSIAAIESTKSALAAVRGSSTSTALAPTGTQQ